MELTNEMEEVISLINDTDKNIFVTGKAGTGKTTLLRHIVRNCKKKYIITAPTGVAAVNAGGVTLHSQFGIPFKPYAPGAEIDGSFNPFKKKILKELKLLIIDEISMVRPDTLDFIDIRMRMCRGNHKPFGGVQVVMFGDLHQLPPVIKKEDREILKNFYKGSYFYNSNALISSGFKMIELSHVFRQKDEVFVNILNNIRECKADNNDFELIEELRDKSASKIYDDGNIHLCALRADSSYINETMLGEPTFTNNAVLTGKFSEGSAPCDMELKLRVGARVMCLVNRPADNVCNGSIGTVDSFTSENEIVVLMDDGELVKFTKYTWEALEYKIKETDECGKKTKEIVQETVGTCCQYPLTLAWAITIHKSQGLTFDNVTIHSKGMFCPGQLYVALSRCRTMEGIKTESFVSKKSVIPDGELDRFENAMRISDNEFGRKTFDLI